MGQAEALVTRTLRQRDAPRPWARRRGTTPKPKGSQMTKTICIYHANCADGFTAAWAVWKALGDAVVFVPGAYGGTPPDIAGADVIMVDFSYKRPVLEKMSKSARSVLVLDHHKTAQADLDGFGVDISKWTPPFGWTRHQMNVAQDACEGIPHDSQYVIFDMDRSGAQIAWDFFHPGKARPKLVDYVGDRDLWRFFLPGSREVAAWLFSHPYDFKTWDRLYCDVETNFGSVAEQGAAIERKHHKDISELLKVTTRTMTIGGHDDIPVANLPYTMASDAAGELAEDAPFAACYFDRCDGQRVFSLRSRGEHGLDVSDIAARYGGGGHRNAAGFQMPIGWEGDAA